MTFYVVNIFTEEIIEVEADAKNQWEKVPKWSEFQKIEEYYNGLLFNDRKKANAFLTGIRNKVSSFDFLEREVFVGESVAVIVPYNRKLAKGTIVGVTKQGFQIRYKKVDSMGQYHNIDFVSRPKEYISKL